MLDPYQGWQAHYFFSSTRCLVISHPERRYCFIRFEQFLYSHIIILKYRCGLRIERMDRDFTPMDHRLDFQLQIGNSFLGLYGA